MKTLKVRSVAEKLGVSVSTVWRLAKGAEGFPRPFKLADDLRATVWDESDIDLYLFTRKQEAMKEVA